MLKKIKDIIIDGESYPLYINTNRLLSYMAHFYTDNLYNINYNLNGWDYSYQDPTNTLHEYRYFTLKIKPGCFDFTTSRESIDKTEKSINFNRKILTELENIHKNDFIEKSLTKKDIYDITKNNKLIYNMLHNLAHSNKDLANDIKNEIPVVDMAFNIHRGEIKKYIKNPILENIFMSDKKLLSINNLKNFTRQNVTCDLFGSVIYVYNTKGYNISSLIELIHKLNINNTNILLNIDDKPLNSNLHNIIKEIDISKYIEKPLKLKDKNTIEIDLDKITIDEYIKEQTPILNEVYKNKTYKGLPLVAASNTTFIIGSDPNLNNKLYQIANRPGNKKEFFLHFRTNSIKKLKNYLSKNYPNFKIIETKNLSDTITLKDLFNIEISDNIKKSILYHMQHPRRNLFEYFKIFYNLDIPNSTLYEINNIIERNRTYISDMNIQLSELEIKIHRLTEYIYDMTPYNLNQNKISQIMKEIYKNERNSNDQNN